MQALKKGLMGVSGSFAKVCGVVVEGTCLKKIAGTQVRLMFNLRR